MTAQQLRYRWTQHEFVAAAAADVFDVCWVVTREVVYEHTTPEPDGYRTVTRYRAGDEIPVPYRATPVAVSALLGDDPPPE